MLNLMIVTSQLVELEHKLQFHKPILVAIEQRNPVLASRLMAEHLNDARNLLLQGYPQGTSRHRRNDFAIGHSSPKSAPRRNDENQLAQSAKRFISFPTATVKVKVVVERNVWPGRNTVVGNLGSLGESGKCCVSRQKPECFVNDIPRPTKLPSR
jgi:hypothetical protein